MKQLLNAKLAAAALIAAVLFSTTAAHAEEQATVGGVVNINTATVAELSFLPGVGPSKAQAIVKYRQSREFKKVEDIMRVKGIGRQSFKQLRPYLTIEGNTTLTKKVKTSR